MRPPFPPKLAGGSASYSLKTTVYLLSPRPPSIRESSSGGALGEESVEKSGEASNDLRLWSLILVWAAPQLAV